MAICIHSADLAFIAFTQGSYKILHLLQLTCEIEITLQAKWPGCVQVKMNIVLCMIYAGVLGLGEKPFSEPMVMKLWQGIWSHLALN